RDRIISTSWIIICTAENRDLVVTSAEWNLKSNKIGWKQSNDLFMRTITQRFAVAVLAVLAGMIMSARCQAGTEKIADDAKAIAEKVTITVKDVVAEVTNAAKEGGSKATQISTNVTVHVKGGVSKATEITTNVVIRTKESFTNTSGKVNEKVKQAVGK